MYSLLRADEPMAPVALAKLPQPRVYLGGQCKGRDWRLEFYYRFERETLTFINPRRDSFVDPELDPAGHADLGVVHRLPVGEQHGAGAERVGQFDLAAPVNPPPEAGIAARLVKPRTRIHGQVE
jgi:hypothetical protein